MCVCANLCRPASFGRPGFGLWPPPVSPLAPLLPNLFPFFGRATAVDPVLPTPVTGPVRGVSHGAKEKRLQHEC